MSKTVITSTGNTKESKFDRRFGRAGWFCLLDESTKELEFIENSNRDAGHGAGTRAAELMVEKGVSKIISGDFGPKAKELLEKFDIQMIIIQEENISIEDVINKIGSGK